MKVRMIFIGMLVIATACKKESTNPVPVTPTITTVSKLTFLNYGSDHPTTVLLENGNTPINAYKEDATGLIKITYLGKNGRDILQDAAVGISSNVARWKLNEQDTIRVFENGVLKSEYTTIIDPSNGGGVFFTSISESEATAKTRFNNYVRNDLHNQKLKVNP